MTEPGPPGETRLRALEIDRATADRVVATVMARIQQTAQLPPDEILSFARRAVRPVLAAAVLLSVAAGWVFMLMKAEVKERPIGMNEPMAHVMNWVEQQHVPTNAELL